MGWSSNSINELWKMRQCFRNTHLCNELSLLAAVSCASHEKTSKRTFLSLTIGQRKNGLYLQKYAKNWPSQWHSPVLQRRRIHFLTVKILNVLRVSWVLKYIDTSSGLFLDSSRPSSATCSIASRTAYVFPRNIGSGCWAKCSRKCLALCRE